MIEAKVRLARQLKDHELRTLIKIRRGVAHERALFVILPPRSYRSRINVELIRRLVRVRTDIIRTRCSSTGAPRKHKRQYITLFTDSRHGVTRADVTGADVIGYWSAINATFRMTGICIVCSFCAHAESSSDSLTAGKKTTVRTP